MKYVIMLCCLFSAGFQTVYAQKAGSNQKEVAISTVYEQSTTGKVITKEQFLKQVEELNVFAKGRSISKVNDKWTDIHAMMLQEFALTKQKIKAAIDNNEIDKTKYYQDVIKRQTEIYNNLIKMKGDISSNKEAVTAQLKLFSSTM